MHNRAKDDNNSDYHIIEKSRKSRFATLYVLIALIVLATIVAVTGVFFDYW